MKKLILVFSLASMPFFAVSQTARLVSQVSKLTSSITTPIHAPHTTQTTQIFSQTIKGAFSLPTVLPCGFEIRTIKGTRYVIETTVTISAASRGNEILNSLNAAGRYNLDLDSLTFPLTKTGVLVNGVDIEERISKSNFNKAWKIS